VTTQSEESREAYARAQTEMMLRAEAQEIHGPSGAALSEESGTRLYQGLNRLNSAALCLSGGGIRSAAFCLGVIQALASHPRATPQNGEMCGPPCEQADSSLLAKFHYLSTVSGGGYIGGWLSAWRSRLPFWNADHPRESIWACLTSRPLGSDQEPAALGWLRSYTNYLTPKLGVLSADTWAAVALSARNLLLNWLVILPVFCALILLLKILSISSDWLTRLPDVTHHLGPLVLNRLHIQGVFAIGGVACQVLALIFMCRNRPTRRPQDDLGPDQQAFVILALLPMFLSALFLAQFLASDFVGSLLLAPKGDLHPRFSLARMIFGGGACGAIIYAVSWIAARVYRNPLDFFLWTIAGAIYGALVALAVFWYIQIPEDGIWIFSSVVLHLVFGIPWIILSQLMAEIIFVGLASYQLNSDADREWLGRAGGWLTIAAIGWCILSFAVFFGAVLTSEFDKFQNTIKDISATLAAVFGAATAVLGKSNLSPSNADAKTLPSKLVNAALSVVAPLFVLALLISMSYLLDQLILGQTLVPDLFVAWADLEDKKSAAADALDLDRLHALKLLAVSLGAFVVVGMMASRCININRFSLHALYRNRLIRAFLGASRRRRPDRFTGFDPHDNPRVHQLWSAPEPENWRPFHIVNMALNVVSSERLAWQERKAEPFVVTPLYCGSSYLGFRKSDVYGDRNGISLGTALAISGAAASPNMGYHSSPAITFLMTMFNVRLGWWLGNPGIAGADTFSKDGPDWAFRPLVTEAFGLTTDQRRYVYLSDGGHFENLGLYEAVRRRCRFIVLVDASCDPELLFEDLGNAVRKIQIDQGITIRFHGLDRLVKRTPDSSIIANGQYYSVGEIEYAQADTVEGPIAAAAHSSNGVILYLKPAYHGIESAGVRSYASKYPEFPHETTLNQWFTESQFESYRSLGFEITDSVLCRASADLDRWSRDKLDALFHALLEDARKARHGGEDTEVEQGGR
jgi:hypothetical protein